MNKMSISLLQKFIPKLTNLRIDRAHGNAPHQPVLLLSIIELIEQGRVCENKIIPSPELVETFVKYWSVITDRKPNLALPFFHLKNSNFWHHHPNAGYENALKVVTQIKTVSRLREIMAYGYFDNDLFMLLTQPDSREYIRQKLIDTYLAHKKQEIINLINEEKQISEYSDKIVEQVENAFFSEGEFPQFEAENKIRKAGFRQAIMRIYEYTCSVCQIHILTLDGESVTEAAHIIPFSISKNDDVRNGISLCKLHHWAFDKGLISLNKTHRVIVSELISERGPTEWRLKTLQGKEILLPDHKELYPAQEALAWHREQQLRR